MECRELENNIELPLFSSLRLDKSTDDLKLAILTNNYTYTDTKYPRKSRKGPAVHHTVRLPAVPATAAPALYGVRQVYSTAPTSPEGQSRVRGGAHYLAPEAGPVICFPKPHRLSANAKNLETLLTLSFVASPLAPPFFCTKSNISPSVRTQTPDGPTRPAAASPRAIALAAPAPPGPMAEGSTR